MPRSSCLRGGVLDSEAVQSKWKYLGRRVSMLPIIIAGLHKYMHVAPCSRFSPGAGLNSKSPKAYRLSPVLSGTNFIVRLGIPLHGHVSTRGVEQGGMAFGSHHTFHTSHLLNFETESRVPCRVLLTNQAMLHKGSPPASTAVNIEVRVLLKQHAMVKFYYLKPSSSLASLLFS